VKRGDPAPSIGPLTANQPAEETWGGVEMSFRPAPWQSRGRLEGDWHPVRFCAQAAWLGSLTYWW